MKCYYPSHTFHPQTHQHLNILYVCLRNLKLKSQTSIHCWTAIFHGILQTNKKTCKELKLYPTRILLGGGAGTYLSVWVVYPTRILLWGRERSCLYGWWWAQGDTRRKDWKVYEEILNSSPLGVASNRVLFYHPLCALIVPILIRLFFPWRIFTEWPSTVQDARDSTIEQTRSCPLNENNVTGEAEN